MALQNFPWASNDVLDILLDCPDPRLEFFECKSSIRVGIGFTVPVFPSRRAGSYENWFAQLFRCRRAVRRPRIAPNIRILLHARPTDMRKSFDGLCGLVRGVLAADPTDGSLFLFVNRRGDRLKALWWDHDGLALFYKRLESGTFEMLRPEGESAVVELDAAELAMLLSGVSLASVKRRKRYARAG